MRFPHRQSGLEMDELRMGLGVEEALLAIKMYSGLRDPRPKVVILLCSCMDWSLSACGGQCPTLGTLEPGALFWLLLLILCLTLRRPWTSLRHPFENVSSAYSWSKWHGAARYSRNLVSLSILMCTCYWLAHLLIDLFTGLEGPWRKGSLLDSLLGSTQCPHRVDIHSFGQ